jgi:hypothetical protein
MEKTSRILSRGLRSVPAHIDLLSVGKDTLVKRKMTPQGGAPMIRYILATSHTQDGAIERIIGPGYPGQPGAPTGASNEAPLPHLHVKRLLLRPAQSPRLGLRDDAIARADLDLKVGILDRLCPHPVQRYERLYLQVRLAIGAVLDAPAAQYSLRPHMVPLPVNDGVG